MDGDSRPTLEGQPATNMALSRGRTLNGKWGEGYLITGTQGHRSPLPKGMKA